MRKAFIFIIALLLAGPAILGPQAGARAAGRDLCQVWNGQFFYQQSGGSVPALFQMTVVVSRGRMLGFVAEPNTFGDKPAVTLHGTIDGTIDGDIIAWTKTYDGTAGVSHSVRYEGRLDSTGRRIEGRWTIAGGGSGTFYADLE